MYDTSSNPSLPIPDIDAFSPSFYVGDSIPPELERFDFNLSSDSLILYFSETVDVTSLDATEISLYNDSNVTAGISLQGAITYTPDGPVLMIVLTTLDLNIIKMNENFATSEDNLHITLTNATIEDIDGNPVTPIEPSIPQKVDRLYADTIPPALESFEFDAHTGILTLSFSETVTISTFNASAVIL